MVTAVSGPGWPGSDTAMTERTVPTKTDEHPDGVEAGRGPTEAESAAADRARSDVDLDKVQRNYDDMLEKGANVKGEGEIEPGH